MSNRPPKGLDCLYTPYEEIPGKGHAIFTRSNVKKGTVIMQIVGPEITWEQLNQIEGIEERERWLQIGPELFVGPAGDFSDYVNHSCDPNCYVKIQKDEQGRGEYLVIALRDIEAESEIVYDYSILQTWQYWRMECLCGSSKCRKIVTNILELDEEVINYYDQMGCIPDYCKEFWKRHKSQLPVSPPLQAAPMPKIN